MWLTTLAGKLERAAFLDPVASVVTSGVDAVLPKGKVKDALHGRPLGHAAHPLMVTAPIGLWTGALLLDLTAGESGRSAAKRLVGAGVLAVAPTAAAGFADWSELGEFRRPKRVGLVHATANAATAALYAASWLARQRGDHRRGRELALLGVVGLSVGGYLGGHLSYAEGVGVNRNADEDAKQPREWTDAVADADVTEGHLQRVEVGGRPIVMTRRDGAVHAMGAVCSHFGAPLDEGEVDDDGCLVCPWHQSRFRLHDGSVARGPATSPQTSYETRLSGGRLQLRARR
ncbi:MAG: iron-sulfur protein [Frankiales bacterium]|jgi:nitrite reductase/ring-hydroxylating ferredoxin subunit/uncharacterized membrane protein|nr:iron-sulfur protein [Frankiales bacterium]